MTLSRPALLLASLLFTTAVACNRSDASEGREVEASPAPKAPPLPVAHNLADYASVCRGGKLAAKPYAKSPTGAPSKVVVFRRYLDDAASTYAWAKPEGLGGLQVQSDAERAETELVACVDLKKKSQSRSQCNFYGGTIFRWVMTHTVRIVNPTTGEVLANDEFEIDPLTTGCPATASFPAGSNSMFEGGEYGGRLLLTLLPLQPEGVGLPPLEARQLTDVCTGTPRPQVAKSKLGERPTVFVAYRPEEGFSWRMPARPRGLPANDLAEKSPASARYVACVTGKPTKKKQSCSFMMGNVLEAYDGELEVVVRETATGKVVGSKSFKASSSGCPSTHTFWGNKDPYFERVEAGVAEFVWGFAGGVPDEVKAASPKPAAPRLDAMLY